MENLYEVIDGSQALPFYREDDFHYTFYMNKGISTYDYDVYLNQDGDVIDLVFKVSIDGSHQSHKQIDMGISGAIRIFHTVWKILKDFLDSSEDPISVITFSAKNNEPSRVKFYTTLATQLARHYGYDAKDVDIHDDDLDTHFTVPIEKIEEPVALAERIDGSKAAFFRGRVTRTGGNEVWRHKFKAPSQPTNTFYSTQLYIDGEDEMMDVWFEYNERHNYQSYAGRYDQRDMGFGTAMEVFHTVWEIIKDVLSKTRLNVKYITFSAKGSEDSRVKLYKTLSAELAREYGHSADEVDISKDKDGDIIFVIPVSV